MAIQRTRKKNRTLRDKENPHYNFLYSWSPTQRVYDPAGHPSQAHVKRESLLTSKVGVLKLSASKRAEIQAKEDSMTRIKKDIIRSLILVSFIIILELVVYLGWSKFFLS